MMCSDTTSFKNVYLKSKKKKVSSCNSSAMCYILPQLNNLEKAVAATHTFLKKNPDDVLLTKNMNYYKTLFDVEEYLIDHEEQPYEVCTLSTVILHQWEVWCLSSMFVFFKLISLLHRVFSWKVWRSTTTETSATVLETWSRPSHNTLKYTTSV